MQRDVLQRPPRRCCDAVKLFPWPRSRSGTVKSVEIALQCRGRHRSCRGMPMFNILKLRLSAFLPRHMATFALGALAIVLLGGGAHAVTDTIFKYTNPRTGFFTIDPMALSADTDSRTY